MFRLRSEWSVTPIRLKGLVVRADTAFAVAFGAAVLAAVDFLGTAFFATVFLVGDFAFVVFVFAFDVGFFVVVAILESVPSLFHF